MVFFCWAFAECIWTVFQACGLHVVRYMIVPYICRKLINFNKSVVISRIIDWLVQLSNCSVNFKHTADVLKIRVGRLIWHHRGRGIISCSYRSPILWLNILCIIWGLSLCYNKKSIDGATIFSYIVYGIWRFVLKIQPDNNFVYKFCYVVMVTNSVLFKLKCVINKNRLLFQNKQWNQTQLLYWISHV